MDSASSGSKINCFDVVGALLGLERFEEKTCLLLLFGKCVRSSKEILGEIKLALKLDENLDLMSQQTKSEHDALREGNSRRRRS